MGMLPYEVGSSSPTSAGELMTRICPGGGGGGDGGGGGRGGDSGGDGGDGGEGGGLGGLGGLGGEGGGGRRWSSQCTVYNASRYSLIRVGALPVYLNASLISASIAGPILRGEAATALVDGHRLCGVHAALGGTLGVVRIEQAGQAGRRAFEKCVARVGTLAEHLAVDAGLILVSCGVEVTERATGAGVVALRGRLGPTLVLPRAQVSLGSCWRIAPSRSSYFKQPRNHWSRGGDGGGGGTGGGAGGEGGAEGAGGDEGGHGGMWGSVLSWQISQPDLVTL
eukprot:scaffold29894_cov59-Phaeocystis_antarctica.AAC.3